MSCGREERGGGGKTAREEAGWGEEVDRAVRQGVLGGVGAAREGSSGTG